VALAIHGLIAVALIAAYVVLRAIGDSGDLVGGLLVGYLGGVGAQVGLRKAGAAPPP